MKLANVVFLGDERPGFPYNARGEHNRSYGDADSVEIDVSNVGSATIIIEGTIDGFVKVGDPLQGNPFAHAPTFRCEISGRRSDPARGPLPGAGRNGAIRRG